MRTITKYLECFGLKLIPFTVQVVYALAAALKWRKYRSAELYLYTARAFAERRGAFVSRAAHRAVSDMVRSCRRGLGPAKRCEGLVMESLPSLPGAYAAWAAGGPWRPRAAITLGAWWMLREIEFSNAELRSVAFNTKQRSVTLALPASKADPSALGTAVTHGCCCLSSPGSKTDQAANRERARARALCPYHQMLDHMAATHQRFPDRFDESSWARIGFPLFPDMHGNVCTKDGVTRSVRIAAACLGQPLRDAGGLYLHTGHALRVTGAQGLARAGLSEHQISLLARWGSSAVLRYIRNAPLASSHRLSAQALAGWRAGGSAAATEKLHRSSITKLLPTRPAASQAAPPLSRSQFAGLEDRLATVEVEVRRIDAWRTEVADTVAAASVAPMPSSKADVVAVIPDAIQHQPYIVSAYRKWHEVYIGHPAQPCNWVTTCGWRFGTSHDAKPSSRLPHLYKDMCERCFFRERKMAKEDAQSRVHEDG